MIEPFPSDGLGATELGILGGLPERKAASMNNEQWMGLLRDLGKFLAPILASYGVLDEATWAIVVGGLSTILLSVWTYYKNRTDVMVSTVAATDDVKKVVMADPKAAAADPNPKVVAA